MDNVSSNQTETNLDNINLIPTNTDNISSNPDISFIIADPDSINSSSLFFSELDENVIISVYFKKLMVNIIILSKNLKAILFKHRQSKFNTLHYYKIKSLIDLRNLVNLL